MVDDSIIKNIQEYLHALQVRGLSVTFGVVFGSQVTGKTHEWSDIDLVVVASRFDHPYTRREIDQLWRVAAAIDSRIEPIPCGEKQWVEDQRIPILEIARQEGQRIDLAEEVTVKELI